MCGYYAIVWSRPMVTRGCRWASQKWNFVFEYMRVLLLAKLCTPPVYKNRIAEMPSGTRSSSEISVRIRETIWYDFVFSARDAK